MSVPTREVRKRLIDINIMKNKIIDMSFIEVLDNFKIRASIVPLLAFE